MSDPITQSGTSGCKVSNVTYPPITAQQFMASLSCNGGTREPVVDKCGNVTYPPPIKDCKHLNAVDGCCGHPDAMTPECHPWADCPPLQDQIASLREQLASADKTLAGFTRAVREARGVMLDILELTHNLRSSSSQIHDEAIEGIRATCESWLNPPLVGAARVVAKEGT